MKMTISTETSADLDSTWSALIDVTAWPHWTASITSVERLDDGPLRIGSRARIDQPKFPTVIWEVTELREREEFSWTTGGRAVRSVGRHVLSRNPTARPGSRSKWIRPDSSRGSSAR